MSYLASRFPSKFFREERIVRVIYNESHVNSKLNKLKLSFIRFDKKNEMSCSRFEPERLEFYKEFGLKNQNPEPRYDRNYYGVACTSVKAIRSLEDLYLTFSPILDSDPKNFFHCDVFLQYDKQDTFKVANYANINYLKELLIDKFTAHKDEERTFTKKSVQPPI